MEDRFDTASEPRKEWVALELKKIDVEEITALNPGASNDGSFDGTS